MSYDHEHQSYLKQIDWKFKDKTAPALIGEVKVLHENNEIILKDLLYTRELEYAETSVTAKNKRKKENDLKGKELLKNQKRMDKLWKRIEELRKEEKERRSKLRKKAAG